MTNDQLFTLNEGDKLHIPGPQGECVLWTIQKQLGKGAFRATFGHEPGYRATLINSNRYELEKIHLAQECPYGNDSKDNGSN